MAVASATQDMAIDAYTIGLVSPGEEGEANGVRVSAYRIALITAGGGLVFLAPIIGWRAVFTACAVLLTILAAATWRAPPVVISIERRRDWRKPLVRWLSRPGAWAVFLFAFSYKLGHAAIGPMIKPFWIDRGLSVAEVGIVSTSFGTAVTIAGALLGGWITTRWGIFRALLLIGLVHAVSNLGYATVAWINPPQPQLIVASLSDVFRALGEPGRSLIYAASMLESFCEGLGDATLLAFLMHVCEKEHAAVEFAALSATSALSVSVCGAISGWATTRLGYGPYFLLTFFLGFPALTLLPILRPWIHDRSALPAAPRLRSAR
jgi:PAT family beta-lactamase induction signal transducer AmpG